MVGGEKRVTCPITKVGIADGGVEIEPPDSDGSKGVAGNNLEGDPLRRVAEYGWPDGAGSTSNRWNDVFSQPFKSAGKN